MAKIEVRHVQQPTPHTCVHSCLSMVTGIPVNDLIARFGDVGMVDEDKATVLCEEGILPVDVPQMGGALHPLPYAGTYLLSVPSLNIPGRGHSIVCTLDDDGDWELYDPNEGREGKAFYSRHGLMAGEVKHYVATLLVPLPKHRATQERIARTLPPTNVVEIGDYRPHYTAPVECQCGHRWQAVYPETATALECSKCGEFVPAPHLTEQPQ